VGTNYQVSFEDVAVIAKEVTRNDGHHVPILIVEGSKSLIVGQIEEMPETHEGRAELMRFMGRQHRRAGE